MRQWLRSGARKNKPRLITKTAWAVASSGVESTLTPVYTPGRNEDISTPEGDDNRILFGGGIHPAP